MPESVRAAVIGEGEYLPLLLHSILEKQILPEINVSAACKSIEAVGAAAGYNISWCDSSVSAVLKSEIVLVCGSYKDFPAILSPIAKATGKCVLVSVSEDPRVDLDFLRERVVRGTELITATIYKEGNEKPDHAVFKIAEGVRLYLHQTCRDLVNSIFETAF